MVMLVEVPPGPLVLSTITAEASRAPYFFSDGGVADLVHSLPTVL
jgi:hypothetical protein